MNLEIAIVLSILSATILLFLNDKVGPDVVAMLAVLALLVTGTLHTADAFAGFGNPVPVTIAAIFLVTAGLTNTGVAAWLGKRIVQIAGTTEPRLIAVTMGAAATLSLVMNNIACASLLMPSLTSLARQTRTNPSKLLIPLSFGTLLGGMATLFTTTNILVNDALRAKGITPFTLWDFFKVGGLITLAGIALMVTVGRRLLPDRPVADATPAPRLPEDLIKLYRLPEQVIEARILTGSLLDARTIAQCELREKYGVNITGILRSRKIKLSPGPDEALKAGDRLFVEGETQKLREAREKLGLACQTEGSLSDLESADRNIGMTEIVVSPHSHLVGQTLHEILFSEKFGLTVLALRREGAALRTGVTDIPLHYGDALLVRGPRGRLKVLRSERDFVVLDDPPGLDEITRPEKAPWAVLSMSLMLILTGLGLLPIAAAAMLSAAVMVISGALQMEEGYKAVEWKAVVMVGGMLAVGTALDKSGAADLLSHQILHALAPLGAFAVLAGFYLVTLFLAQVISGPAITALIAPIALSAASQLGVSPYPLLMGVNLAASSAFITPVSHPANVLVMGPGGYKFRDYVRVGSVLALMVGILALTLVPIFWPL
jgi:di/tricarboxylate transporter